MRRPVLFFSFILAAMLAAGCATPPTGAPPLTPGPDVQPNFLVPSARERMVYLARQEWAVFGRGVAVRDANGTWQLAFDGDATHEVQPGMLSRVLMYWYAVTRAPIVGHQGELQPWSAAFVSSLARFGVDSAGLLLPRDDRGWVAVIEQRDPAAAR
jgi:hypothetical protein